VSDRRPVAIRWTADGECTACGGSGLATLLRPGLVRNGDQRYHGPRDAYRTVCPCVRAEPAPGFPLPVVADPALPPGTAALTDGVQSVTVTNIGPAPGVECAASVLRGSSTGAMGARPVDAREALVGEPRGARGTDAPVSRQSLPYTALCADEIAADAHRKPEETP
jgi:hypothetical protein